MTSLRTEETRRRLVAAALHEFAEKGFAKASTRDIASRAKANIASIHYHFGDKAGLYRAVFEETFKGRERPGSVSDSFEAVFRGRAHEIISSYREEHTKKLLAREHIEPTGLLGPKLFRLIRQRHEVLTRLMTRELGLKRADIDIQRLALACIGMATIFGSGGKAVKMLAPAVLKNEEALETLLERITAYAQVLLEAERERRAGIARSQAAGTP